MQAISRKKTTWLVDSWKKQGFLEASLSYFTGLILLLAVQVRIEKENRYWFKSVWGRERDLYYSQLNIIPN